MAEVENYYIKPKTCVVPLTESTLPVRFGIVTDLALQQVQFSYWDDKAKDWVCLSYSDLTDGETKIQTSLSEMEII